MRKLHDDIEEDNKKDPVITAMFIALTLLIGCVAFYLIRFAFFREAQPLYTAYDNVQITGSYVQSLIDGMDKKTDVCISVDNGQSVENYESGSDKGSFSQYIAPGDIYIGKCEYSEDGDLKKLKFTKNVEVHHRG